MLFDATFFHLGIHNIPRRDARPIMEVLTNFTFHPREEKLGEILAMLRSYSDIDVKTATALSFSSIWSDGGPEALKHMIGALRLLGRVDALLFSRLHERRYVEYARSRWATD